MHFQICAISRCRNPLENYRDGRFCTLHAVHATICGLDGCNHPVNDEGGPTCNNPSHMAFYRGWRARFGRNAFHAVRNRDEEASIVARLPLGPNGEPGSEVAHTFAARRVFCLETIQWACGYPIGWIKCYDAEGESQVLDLLNFAFPPTAPMLDLRPQFVAYDKACRLLRHIARQNLEDPWIISTRFIIDPFHYLNHRADDDLCHNRCNPAPANGSQPDLVTVTTHEDGTVT